MLAACGGGDTDAADDATDAAEETSASTTTEETAATEAASAAADCELSVEQAADLSGLPVDVVESHQLSSEVTECRYYEGTSEDSAPKFRYRFTPGRLHDDGEPLTVGGFDARYSETTGQLLVQIDEGQQLNVSGYAVERDNLVLIAETLLL